MGIEIETRKRLIVCDTGPILHLQEIGLLDILQKAGKIYIPRMVDIEINSLIPQWKNQKPEWILIEALLPEETREAEFLSLSGLLNPGEAFAIVLAKRLKPKWFLTDDTEARIFANALRLEVHGSLGILLWAAKMGHLDYLQAKEALERFPNTSLWISKDILLSSQKALKVMFKLGDEIK
ncbi:MAG: DUF3368 domain-containing protein [bacterium]